MWPLWVAAGQIQPSWGLPGLFHRCSRIVRTLGVIGSSLRAAFVLPWVTNRLPLRPFTQVIASHRSL